MIFKASFRTPKSFKDYIEKENVVGTVQIDTFRLSVLLSGDQLHEIIDWLRNLADLDSVDKVILSFNHH